jgi:cupin 2 domain-containing protein
MSAFNFFSTPGENASREEFLTLHESDGLKIERITSHGQASPDGFWYDQSNDEWVMLVQGDAILEFEDGRRLELRAGDCQFIAKHVRHRVAHTSMDTLWLAVHSGAEPS